MEPSKLTHLFRERFMYCIEKWKIRIDTSSNFGIPEQSWILNPSGSYGSVPWSCVKDFSMRNGTVVYVSGTTVKSVTRV
jgi:hypothetical protein